MRLRTLDMHFAAAELLGVQGSKEIRFGIRIYLTNERLILVDAEPDNGSRMEQRPERKSFLTKNYYKFSYEIESELWCGQSSSSASASAAHTRRRRRRHGRPGCACVCGLMCAAARPVLCSGRLRSCCVWGGSQLCCVWGAFQLCCVWGFGFRRPAGTTRSRWRTSRGWRWTCGR